MMALITIRLPQLPNGRDDTLSMSTHSVLSPREAHTLTQLTRAWFPVIQGLISDTENSSFTKNNLELDSDVLNSHKHDSGSRRNILTDSMFSTPQVSSHREEDCRASYLAERSSRRCGCRTALSQSSFNIKWAFAFRSLDSTTEGSVEGPVIKQNHFSIKQKKDRVLKNIPGYGVSH